jgi:FkbM family methyltransferase
VHFYKVVLSLVSRPSFFAFWLLARKLSTHALNMSAAARLPCEETGEQIALSYSISKRIHEKTIIIFDVGANIGQYANMCLKQLNSITNDFDIYSFEPTSAAAEALRKHFHSSPRVHVYQLGLGNEPGEQSLYFPWQTSSGASAHPDSASLWNFSGELIEERALFRTVDDFIDEHSLSGIHLLKIDVEGTELRVIEGARKAIKARIIKFIQFEISGGTMLNKTYLHDFWCELSSMYRFFLIMNQGLVEITNYSAHLENFVGASNFLLELRA